LSEVQSELLSAVPRHKKPTRKPLLRIMYPVASCDLSGYASVALDEMEDAPPDFFRIPKGVCKSVNEILNPFRMPGAAVDLNGTFNFRDHTVHLLGNLHIQSDISHVTTGFKSLLMKPLIPFLRKDNSGAVIPIAITGSPHGYKVTQNLLHDK
jgi:hypothetical protein